MNNGKRPYSVIVIESVVEVFAFIESIYNSVGEFVQGVLPL